MKRILLAIGLWALCVSCAFAQNSSNSICFTTNGSNCIPVDANHPFPVTVGGSGNSVTIAGPLAPQLTTASIAVAGPTDPDSRPTSGTITAQDVGSSVTSGLITGTPTVSSFQTQAINGQATARVLITNTWTGTLEFDGSIDSGTTWFIIYPTASTSANGAFTLDVAGFTNVRVRAIATWTGTATVRFTFTSSGVAGNKPASQYYLQPTASDNHAVIKNGPGTVYSVLVSNNSATKNYMRLYDLGTGFNGCGSATGLLFGMEIPPTDSGFAVTIGGSLGLLTTTGLSICVTSGYGSTDTTNATATAMMLNVIYK